MVLPKIILLDLDETIHFSEEMKTKAWSDILRPFGFCWEEENIGDLISIPKDKRPKPGLSPHDFITTLIDNLNLNNITSELHGDNLTLEETKYREGLSGLLFDENKYEKMIEIMKNYWSASLINEAQRFVKEGRIKEVSGAVEAIMSAHQKGFKIGVVTQAPAEYAEIVLSSLGLLNNKVEENYIDAVVSGDIVGKPKPDPESLVLATELIIIQTAIKEKKTDVSRKLTIKEKIEIGQSIHQEYFIPEKEKFPSPVAIVGDSIHDMEAGSNYPGINPVLRILISNGLSYLQIKEIKHDITLLHFRELMPKLEGIQRKIEIK